jgi:hypothetical protein
LILKQRNSFIFKIRKDLDEVILYEGIAQGTTEFLNSIDVRSWQNFHLENYIDTLKKKDEAKRIIEEKLKEKQENRKK